MTTGFEQDLLAFYNEYYKDIFEKYGFDFYQKVVGPGMGASLTLAGHGMVIRITNDRDQYFISIGNEIGERFWWDLEFIMSYFKIIDETPADKNVRKRILCHTYSWQNYSDNAEYFLQNFERIKALFTPANFSRIKDELKELNKELGRYRRENWNNPG